MKNSFINSIDKISNQDYKNILKDDDSPLISHEFLNALEASGSAMQGNGWQPMHLILEDDSNLSGFLPLYLKNNSHGEFVFDHQWSYALKRAGREYYPKLLSAIPFTPCETRKFISKNQIEASSFIDPTIEYMEKNNVETWHILFPDESVSEDLIKNNFIKRGGYRFVWNNKNYSNFDEFLNIFTSRQRKNIRTERNKILKNNISFSIKDKQNITLDDWKTFYEFYKSTYLERMQAPYLNFSFFELIHKNKDILQPVIFFAELNEQSVGGSLCFQGKDILYGRHWGASMMVDSLHFECCYYQGIDYCIKNNIKYFDPGVQGEHKIRRGFEPRLCNSYHYVIKEDFRKAIDSFCIEEYKSIEQYLMACEKYTPIKKEYRI
ncbi:GNAT family N-acetyltransferase [Gammaproteobacteria bacterium]|jgi:predicted N-acyltransferase|nr:GNAT family N-acetyltransferase [Gammaproteobacteria bacterium]